MSDFILMSFIRKFFLICFSILFYSNTLVAANKYEGHGPLTLQDIDVKVFKEYISPPAGQSPSAFYVLIENGDVIWSTYWYCPYGACQTHVKSQASKKCRMAAEKFYKRSIYEDCKVFALKRTIVWKNNINPGRGKVSKVSSKWNEKQLRAKLTELGFLGNNTSSKSSSSQDNSNTKKTTKKKKTTGEISDKDIKRLKDLKKLFDDGILTQDEFNAQKKKILE